MKIRALAVMSFLVVAGCAAGADPAPGQSEPEVSAPAAEPANPKGTGATASAKIDNSKGGSVALPDGTHIDIPAGALPPGVDTITITSAPEAAPVEYAAASPMFIFEPDGTVFLKPVKVTVPVSLPAGTDLGTMTILWSRSNAPGYDIVPSDFAPVAGSATDYLAAAEVTHFSKGFCGKKYGIDPHPAKDPYADKK